MQSVGPPEEYGQFDFYMFCTYTVFGFKERLLAYVC